MRENCYIHIIVISQAFEISIFYFNLREGIIFPKLPVLDEYIIFDFRQKLPNNMSPWFDKYRQMRHIQAVQGFVNINSLGCRHLSGFGRDVFRDFGDMVEIWLRFSEIWSRLAKICRMC